MFICVFVRSFLGGNICFYDLFVSVCCIMEVEIEDLVIYVCCNRGGFFRFDKEI